MKIRRKTVLNILLIGFVLSFFVTPLGQYSKVLLMQLFAFSPSVIDAEDRERIASYDWKLKDDQWNFINFREAEGRVVILNFWASWRLPCLPEMRSLQALYEDYGDRVAFYVITDEEREPVEEFMSEYGFTIPVTYLIIGEQAPVDTSEPPRSYLIDRDGYIVVAEKGISDWDSSPVRNVLEELLAR